VAAATWGLLSVVHITKGITLASGAKSMIVPAGIFPALTLLAGNTASWLGPAPKEHIRVPPLQTSCAIFPPVDHSVDFNSG
jgi:hypothetical protein